MHHLLILHKKLVPSASPLCCRGRGGEPFHWNGTGGKIWDLIQQHEEQHLQVFSAVIGAYGMLVHQAVQYTQCCHLGFQTQGRNGLFYQNQ
ncbi:hypothetical protein Hanom_Chr13g01190471 [Helianthus anomalus]